MQDIKLNSFTIIYCSIKGFSLYFNVKIKRTLQGYHKSCLLFSNWNMYSFIFSAGRWWINLENHSRPKGWTILCCELKSPHNAAGCGRVLRKERFSTSSKFSAQTDCVHIAGWKKKKEKRIFPLFFPSNMTHMWMDRKKKHSKSDIFNFDLGHCHIWSHVRMYAAAIWPQSEQSHLISFNVLTPLLLRRRGVTARSFICINPGDISGARKAMRCLSA